MPGWLREGLGKKALDEAEQRASAAAGDAVHDRKNVPRFEEGPNAGSSSAGRGGKSVGT